MHTQILLPYLIHGILNYPLQEQWNLMLYTTDDQALSRLISQWQHRSMLWLTSAKTMVKVQRRYEVLSCWPYILQQGESKVQGLWLIRFCEIHFYNCLYIFDAIIFQCITWPPKFGMVWIWRCPYIIKSNMWPLPPAPHVMVFHHTTLIISATVTNPIDTSFTYMGGCINITIIL